MRARGGKHCIRGLIRDEKREGGAAYKSKVFLRGGRRKQEPRTGDAENGGLSGETKDVGLVTIDV